MPFITEDLQYITVRLEGQTNSGISIGTGFYFGYNDRLFLVTNKHVVSDVVNGSFVSIRARVDNVGKTPLLGEGLPIAFNKESFIGHPDPDIDVSVMNLSAIVNQLESNASHIYYKCITLDSIPNKEQIQQLIAPLEEIVFIGYPSGIWDTANPLPVMRKGVTATPYFVDFKGKPQFLIDASVFPGSSGSPVFIYHAGSYVDRNGTVHIGSLLFFIGIIAMVFTQNERGQIIIEEAPTQLLFYTEIQQMIDLGVVFKPIAIIETADHYISEASKDNR